MVNLGKFKIHVARPVSDLDNDFALDPILSKIFINPEKEDLKPMVPVYWRCYLAGTDSKSRSDAWQATLNQNGTPILKAGASHAGTLIPPRLISPSEPKYSKEAASHHIEGTSHLGVVIDTTGTPVEAAILQPLGMGLDEQAVLAVTRWKFRPSTLNGDPVPVQVNIEVTFKCCP